MTLGKTLGKTLGTTHESIHSLLDTFYSNMSAFAPSPSTTLAELPESPSTFKTLYVDKSRPAIFSTPPPTSSVFNGSSPLPSCWSKLSSLATLRSSIGSRKVTVNVTPPHGHGDYYSPSTPVGGERFVMPLEVRMSFCDFMDKISRQAGGEDSPVYYYSQQNDNLRDSNEGASWLKDEIGLPTRLPYFEAAFSSPSCSPAADAVNLWVGDGRATTSLHSDPYHNVYTVTRGVKTFHILPPWCGGLLEERNLDASRFRMEGDGSEMGMEDLFDETTGERVRTKWIVNDMAPLLGARRHPLGDECPPLPEVCLDHVTKMTISAGQTLYLPPSWYHAVTSDGPTIAVNYWYDMDFNDRWGYENLVKGLQKIVRVN